VAYQTIIKVVYKCLIIVVLLHLVSCSGSSNINNEKWPVSNSFDIKICLFKKHPPLSSIDPAELRYYVDQFILYNVGDTLVRYDENNQIQGQLAKEWRISSDKKSVEFTLRDCARFSDGTPITSEDVAATFKRLLIKKSNMHFRLHEYVVGADKVGSIDDTVDGIQVISENKIVLSFVAPVLGIINKLALSEFIILPKKAINPLDLRIDWSVTSGAYYVKEWNGTEFTLLRNDYSILYSPKSPSKVTSIVNTNFYQSVAMVTNNEVQLLSMKVPLSAKSEDCLSNINVEILARNFEWNNFIVLNPYSRRFRSLNARRTISSRVAKMDISSLPENIFRRAHEIFPDGLLGHTNIRASYEGALADDPAEFTLMVVDKYKTLKVDYLKKELSKLGIKIKCEFVDFDEMHRRVRKREFEAVFMAAGTSAQFPDAFFTFFLNPDTPYLIDPDGIVEKLAKEMVVAKDKYGKKMLIERATRQLLDQATFIPILFETVPIIVNNRYHFNNIQEFGEDIPLWQFRMKS